jgi:hypothetical protein
LEKHQCPVLQIFTYYVAKIGQRPKDVTDNSNQLWIPHPENLPPQQQLAPSHKLLHVKQHDLNTQKAGFCTPNPLGTNARCTACGSVDMAEAKPIPVSIPTPRALQTPPRTGASEGSCFADSAIDMDTITPTISSQSKPQYESEEIPATPSPIDNILEQSSSHKLPNPATENVQHHSDIVEPITHSCESIGSRDLRPESDTDSECHFEQGPELLSHLSTTVSSLRLRHQEQSHLQSLFTSKLEALAQRSLQHGEIIRSLAAEIKALRDSNATLGRENALLAHENHDLHVAMQDLRSEIKEREMAMEAMTGAVRGLEGWIESANNSPLSNLQGRPLSDARRHTRGRKEVIRGKGRFRGRYFIEDHEATDINGDLRMDAPNDVDTVEIQEGIMAWVRGFKDVEEGLKARNEGDDNDSAREAKQVNGRPPGHQSNNTTDPFDEEFGDFETI